MKVSINTIGCRFNQVESAEMRGILEEHGFEITSSSHNADICIINTCTVTGKSDYRSRRAIRKAADSSHNAVIIVTGCYAQMNKNETAELNRVKLVLGNDKKLDIIKYINKITAKTGPAEIAVDETIREKEFPSYLLKNFLDLSRATVKIQIGCDNSCSYCIVYKARGKSRSCPPEDVEKQVRVLTEKGFKEVVLTGVHIGSYGRDLFPKTTMDELLSQLVLINWLERIRISSLSPTEISDGLISLIGDSSRICSHLHITLQSGDDGILARMKRDYDSAFFKETALKIYSRIPDICMGVDVMVGFPGETDKQFEQTFALLKDLPIAYMHIFRYSPRKGTEAYHFDDQVKESVKKERAGLLKSLSKEKTLSFRKGSIGRVKKIIVEAKRDNRTGLLKGLTDNYIPVLIDGSDDLMNTLTDVKIDYVNDDRVYGCRINRQDEDRQAQR